MATPSTKTRGSNHQPPQQTYHARPGKRIKRATEQVKRLYGIDKLTPEQRSGIALLVNPL
jgi:hypothetical protein